MYYHKSFESIDVIKAHGNNEQRKRLRERNLHGAVTCKKTTIYKKKIAGTVKIPKVIMVSRFLKDLQVVKDVTQINKGRKHICSRST